jgi:hypothetical protein
VGILLAFLAALPAPAHANCTPGMQDYEASWPSDGATGVPTDARILVQRFGTDPFRNRAVRYSLAPDAGQAIPLRVAEDLRSGSRHMHQRTLVLAAQRPLAPRARYRLVIQQAGYTQTVAFTTGDGPDPSAPAVRALRVAAFQRIEMGCGPAQALPIEVDARDESAVWVRLRVARDATELAAGRFLGEVILVVANGRVEFGHDMCVGNWGLQRGQSYVARATVLDPALHEVDAGTLALDAR